TPSTLFVLLAADPLKLASLSKCPPRIIRLRQVEPAPWRYRFHDSSAQPDTVGSRSFSGTMAAPGSGSEPMPASNKHWKRWLMLAVLALALLAAWGVSRMRGPVLPGYEVQAGPLVQDVVATGRVANPSRVQIGAEITGLVLERRVIEGDRVSPGDVLVLLRAQDLEARRDQARAALAAIREADLPEAQARLRQARAQLAQAERELARRKELVARQLVARETVEQTAQAVVTAHATVEQARLAVDALAGGAREVQAREALAAADAALAHAEIRATVAGTVLSRSVEPGDTVRPGDVLLVIAADAPGE